MISSELNEKLSSWISCNGVAIMEDRNPYLKAEGLVAYYLRQVGFNEGQVTGFLNTWNQPAVMLRLREAYKAGMLE